MFAGGVCERSLRRSRIRRGVLISLCSLGEAFIGQLAGALAVDRKYVRAALLGHEPKFSTEFSLVALGLAEAIETPAGRVFRITPRGRRKARQWTSRRRHRRPAPL